MKSTVKGRAKTLLALVLVSDFYYLTMSALVILWWRNVGAFFSCVWFDSFMALPVTKVSYVYTWRKDHCSVPTVWCCCQQAKTENSYKYEVTSSYGEQGMTAEILGFLEKRKGTIFCVIRVFWWGRGPKNLKQRLYHIGQISSFDTTETFWNRQENVSISLKEFTVCTLFYDCKSNFCFWKDFTCLSGNFFEIDVAATQRRYYGGFQ